MFSIVIPLYNKSSYIEKCLQSVFNQTFWDFEVIVVNDGSTDGGDHKVQSIIEEISPGDEKQPDKGTSDRQTDEAKKTTKEQSALKPIFNHKNNQRNFKIQLINQENSGVSTARNNGVEASKYDYIAFLDADDWWNERFLEEMKALIEACPEAALYGCNYFYVKYGKNKLEDKGLPADFCFGYIDYFSIYSSRFVVPFNSSFVIVRKESFISSGGFKSNLKFGEDLDLWLKIALKSKTAYLNKPIAFSNQDAETANRSVGNRKIYSPEENIIFNLDHLQEVESEQPALKTLLDGLRVRALIKYHLLDIYEDKTSIELKKVDFSKQPFYFKVIYFFPKPLVKLYFELKKTGSKIKHAVRESPRG